MTERAQFVLAAEEGLYSIAELSARFGVSRQPGYKRPPRNREGDTGAMADRSRAPRQCPHRTASEGEVLLIDCRKARPRWGPKTLIAYLARRHPEGSPPAPSTAGAILSRNGLIEPKRRRRPTRHPGASSLQTEAPNQVWTTDFKGQFKTGDGIYCFPLTVADAHSRFLLGIEALPSVKQQGAFSVFDRLFRRWGLPDAIRTAGHVRQ